MFPPGWSYEIFKGAKGAATGRRKAKRFNAQQWAHVEAYLRLYLSPQQTGGRLKLEQAFSISAECIYLHAYQDKAQGGDLVNYLRCQKVRRKRYASGQERRSVLRNRIGIEQSPGVVDKRSRIGDWEGDTVICKGHQGAWVTLVERKSRYKLAAPLPSRHSEQVTRRVIEFCAPILFTGARAQREPQRLIAPVPPQKDQLVESHSGSGQ